MILYTLCCLLLAVTLPASAQDSPIFGLMLENDVDVRIGPDFAYRVVGRLPRDASVVIIGRTGFFFRSFSGQTWLQIQYGDRPAWVLARTVRFGRAFNSIPETALQPPRDRNGRIPEGFDLSSEICSQWVGSFTQSGNFMAGAAELIVNYPVMPGATNYVIRTVSPSGVERSFDSRETTGVIPLNRLPAEAGVYTWAVIPVWNLTADPFRAQQVCLPRTGGTFEKPDTTPVEETPAP
jgi:hypothetical protein